MNDKENDIGFIVFKVIVNENKKNKEHENRGEHYTMHTLSHA